MFAHLPRQGTHPPTAVRKSGARLRRLVGLLAAVTCGLLASAAIIPAAFARVVPYPGGYYGPVRPAPVPAGAHTALRLPPGGVFSRLEGPVQFAQQPATAVPARIHAVTGGMPGWQITLIAIAAALAAATLAVLVDRAVSSRRRVIATAA